MVMVSLQQGGGTPTSRAVYPKFSITPNEWRKGAKKKNRSEEGTDDEPTSQPANSLVRELLP